jgi:hypothetical protein
MKLLALGNEGVTRAGRLTGPDVAGLRERE